MGGSYRVRRGFEPGQLEELARLLSSVDSLGRREMADFLAGKFAGEDFLPFLRRSLKRVLGGDSLTPSRRARLMEWASEIGLQTHGADEPQSVRKTVRWSPSLIERVELAAAAHDESWSDYVREAVLMRLNAEKAGA